MLSILLVENSQPMLILVTHDFFAGLPEGAVCPDLLQVRDYFYTSPLRGKTLDI